MNENGGDNARRAGEALSRFIRSRWEDRDTTLFVTGKPKASAAKALQPGSGVPPAQFRTPYQDPPASQPVPAPGAGSQPSFPAVASPPAYYAGAGKTAQNAAPSFQPADGTKRHQSGIIEPQSTAKGRELMKHWNAINSCMRCGLGKTRNCFVYGMGRADTTLVFIGEAPGEQEDLKGLPFIGAAGKMLDGILAQLGLTRDSYFICNVLKCRPPGNRNPSPEEIEKCAPHLEKQMGILAPKYVVALGTFAAQSILKTIKPIGQLRGKWHQLPGFEVLPVYHPAAACRSSSNRKVLEDDMKFLKQRLEEDGAKARS